MNVWFCGVRGSTPAPGAAFVAVGGNTSCVAVGPAEVPTLILDAGTGIRAVAPLLDGAAFRGTILLSHLHWDHVHGLPFFSSADRPDARAHLVLPRPSTADHWYGDDDVRALSALDVLRRGMAPPHFPITPEGLDGDWSFEAIDEGAFELEGFRVTAREIPHKGGRTFGYRIDDGTASLAFLPDHQANAPGPWRAGVDALVEGADLVVHDAQFLEPERHLADEYGHSTVADAVALAERAGAVRLALFHHSPTRTDEQVDQILVAHRSATVEVLAAREGLRLSL